MTEEEVKGLLKEASEKIKEDFIPNMTNLLMDVFQHGINKGAEIGVKIGSDKAPSSIKWKTGEPKEGGYYLTTLKNGKIRSLVWSPTLGYFTNYCLMEEIYDVVAWCKLSDIEPYKEETT